MSDYKKPIQISDRLKDLRLVKYQPSAFVNDSVNYVKDVLDGKIEILEPNNSVYYCLESSGVNTVFAVMEAFSLTRKLYPRLANTEEDLYLHMSDEDYLGRFSAPSYARVSINILYNDFLKKAYLDPVTGDRIFTIPRYFNVKAQGLTFTLPTPIEIRRTASGIPDVRYNQELTDELFPPNTHYINYRINEIGQGEKHLSFEVMLPEIELESVSKQISQSRSFMGSVRFDKYGAGRLFYYLRAYARDQNGFWKELIVTHTDEVYDINTPTCIIKVIKNDKRVDYYIPPNYIESGLIQETVKFVIYTTKGPVNVDYSDATIEDFKTSYNPIFTEVENDITTTAFGTIGRYSFIRGKVIGGSGEKDFNTLKSDVINNNLRPNLPITSNQIDSRLSNTGLLPVRNYDVVTGREFLMKTDIPSSVSRYQVSRMSIDMMELKTSYMELFGDKNGVVKIADDIAVIPQGTLLKVNELSALTLLTKEERILLESRSGHDLVRELNSKSYFSLYYHYVLDSSHNTTELRAYDLTEPEINFSSVLDYNDTTLLGLQSTGIDIVRTEEGYRVDTLVDLKLFGDNQSIYNIKPVLVYTGNSGGTFYLEGSLYIDVADNHLFRFYIKTDGYIDGEDKLFIHNFKQTNGNNLTVSMGIKEELSLIYITDTIPSGFIPKSMDALISGSFLAGSGAVVTLEKHEFTFGERFKYLFSRTHSSTGLAGYQTYDEDVYRSYTKTVYNKDNEVIHRPGDEMLDSNGEKIILHEKGDNILDTYGNPIVESREDLARYLNIMLIDYKIERANTPLIRNYKHDVRLHFKSLLLNRVTTYQDELLERTEAFLTVPNSVIDIAVIYDGRRGYIKSAQSFKFTVYVTRRVYEDNNTRTEIEATIRETLDEYLTNRKAISKLEILEAINKRTRSFTKSIDINNLTELNANYIELATENSEISVKKRSTVVPDGYNVEDDIAFNFIIVDDNI